MGCRSIGAIVGGSAYVGRHMVCLRYRLPCGKEGEALAEVCIRMMA